ncbi:hypothetical protein OTC26_010925 [Streptomyces tirandamycinicus]|nr:hypothetical protein [Streptomyces tirandamycinicus]
MSELRHQLVERLRADSHIRTAAVERAFRAVPRHAFAPDVAVEAAYANDIIPTRHAPDGRVISSVSAPWLQVDVLEAARIRPGHRVLEISSGGYNAALMASGGDYAAMFTLQASGYQPSTATAEEAGW